MTGLGLIGTVAPCGCSDPDVNVPQELCHMPPAAVVKCGKNHRNIIFPKKKKRKKKASRLQTLWSSVALRSHRTTGVFLWQLHRISRI